MTTLTWPEVFMVIGILYLFMKFLMWLLEWVYPKPKSYKFPKPEPKGFIPAAAKVMQPDMRN